MTIYFKWTKDMSVGEDHIDHQHQELLEQLNKIIEVMISGAQPKEVSEAVDFFDRYYQEHFSYEEHYMKENNYTFLEEHQGKHKEFMDKYIAFKNRLEGGSRLNELVLEIETYLGQWWIEHIGKEDQKYHHFINGIL
jgi:hemerythrin